MNPSNSKIAAVSRRLTAFMAALVLLAALALPAYAEASGEQTTAALPLLAETTEDTNAPDALDAADAADAAAQDESLTPDTDDDTLQGDAAPAQDADPAQQDDNEEIDQSEEAQSDPKAEAAAEEPQDETAAALQENTEEAKQGEENLNDANEENAADDLQQDANAEDELLTVDEDEAGRVAEYAGTLNVGDKFSIYFLAPMDWDESQKITVYGRLNNNADPNKESQYEWTATPTEKKVADGRTLYKIDAVLGKDKSSDTCPYGGYKFIQIQQENGNSANWVKLYGYVTNDGNWVTADELANQCIDFNKLQAQSESNVLTGETKSQWLQPLSSLKIVHTAYAGKPMRFKNESGDALTNVTAVFYDKDDTGDAGTSGELKVVLRQTLGDINAGKTSSVFYIPKESCAYVQFFSENNELGKCYNFYGEGLDEEGTETPSFEYNSATACVFAYKGIDTENAWLAGTASTIYFDATFSKLSYVNTNTGDEAGYACSIPNANNEVYYCIKLADGGYNSGTATQVGETDYWSVTVPAGASQIFFSAWPWDQKTTSPTTNTGSATDWLDIPTIYDEPCFVADTGDNSISTGNKTLRGGYWTEKGTLHDAEKAKGIDVVDITKTPFVSNSSTKYITSTLYDYYTDWELNGNNRDEYKEPFTEGQLSWVPFRQFDQAISEYYQKSKENIKYPIYTGHFQTDETVKTNNEDDKKKLFSKIADTLSLFGWATKTSDLNAYKKFMAANNSELDITEGTGKYNYTFLGIAANNLDSNGNILMNGTSNLVMPHFNEDFLTGNNSKNAKLGEVYHNVSFPFTKEEVFDDEPGVQYWWFDSSQTSLYLRQDPATDKLYLGNKGANGATANTTDANSMNVNAGSNTDNVSTTYGFFPFNENATSVNANTYNYGYGTKLEIPFTLTSDGMVEANGDNGETKKVPIRYYFSGDDDVWVYIDGQLVLDIGGAHGKVSGIIDFDQTGKNKDSVTAYVSRVKYDGTNPEYSENNYTSVKSIPYKFNTGSKDKHVNDYYYSDTVSIPDLTTGTHTLTMYYMERGMWESNMAVAFNFPDHNELEVEKEVDFSDVNEIFKSSFQNRELFTFTIQNQATHYGLKEATGAGDVETANVNLTEATPTPATTTTGSGNIFELANAPNDNQQSLHWFAQYTDTGSQYRAKRYGILTLNDAINISQMKYLTFKLYVKSESGQYTPAISNMYLELVDSNGKQKGGVDGATLSGTTYGTVTMKEDEWITVKLDLNKLIAEDYFDATKLQKIRFGCNYPRNIYLKDFTFTSAVPDAGMVGFTTQQADIPDYGSATSGKLENATNARFTSTKEGAGTQVVDENGKFLLADGETVTFTDQFRRGSYISLNEELNETLFATSWTLYENGEPVTSMANGNKVTNPSQIPDLVDVESSGPDDGRTEKVGTGAEEQTGNSYTGRKPNANTIVFRSYSTPDAESDAAFTKLKVKYTNKVKTGSLKIVKKAADGEDLDGDYTFTVTFTNIGGLGLETEPITKTVTIQGTRETTITGIPIGTRFRVEETGQSDGAHLQGVTITNCADDAAVIDNKQVHGTITEQDGAADVKIATVTFTNTKRELFDLQLTKQWKDADGKELTANLPSQIYVQLQRKKDADTGWVAVRYPDEKANDYVTITPNDGGWNYLFSGLDRKEVNDTNDGATWTYRVVEGTLDESGNFTPLEDGKTILLEGNVYTVTGGEETTGQDGKAAITLTNTLQNPKFALDVTKRSADEEENGSKKPLAGVEFKLEKLNEDGSTVDENFEAITGITNDNGQLMLKDDISKKAFTGLEAGTYRLTETKTAEGYSLLSAPIKVVFGKDGTCTLDGVEVEVLSDTNPTDFTKNSDGSYTLTLTVLNRKTPLLPHTGADAPSLWLLIGLPLAVAGLLILVFRYNKKGGRRQ